MEREEHTWVYNNVEGEKKEMKRNSSLTDHDCVQARPDQPMMPSQLYARGGVPLLSRCHSAKAASCIPDTKA